MTPFIGVIADTHGLLRPEALEALAGAELIVHAGDLGDPTILGRLRKIAPVHAVRGNVDGADWAEDLPYTQVVPTAGGTLYILHIIEELDLDPAAADFAAVIFGHSHTPHIEHKNNVLYFNPGSAGQRRFDLPVTLGRLTWDKGPLEAEIVELPIP